MTTVTGRHGQKCCQLCNPRPDNQVACFDPPAKLLARYSPSRRVAGRVEDMEGLCELLAKTQGQYDAVALSSVIDVPPEYHQAPRVHCELKRKSGGACAA